MNILDNVAEIGTIIKNQMAEIFQVSELSQLARKSKFIQRTTALLQAKDFVDLMIASSFDPKAVPLKILCSTLRKLNSEADLTKQSLMERINRPEASEFLKAVFEISLKRALTKCVFHSIRSLIPFYPISHSILSDQPFRFKRSTVPL